MTTATEAPQDSLIITSPIVRRDVRWTIGSVSARHPISFESTPLTDAQAAAYQASGFEIGLHVNTNCSNFTPASLENFFADQLTAWSSKYTSLNAPVTNRTHCIAWSDWATHPKVELNHGIRLDANYYYWPGAWVQDRPGMFTGSGMPMRFADLDGSTIDVYQAATEMTDESGITIPTHIESLIGKALSDRKASTALSPPTCIPTIPTTPEQTPSSPQRSAMACLLYPENRC